MFSPNRRKMREVFFHAWQQYRNQQTLAGVESLIVAVALRHPEYHPVLDDKQQQDQDYLPEMGQTNPFLHMSLHIAIEEQLSIDQPPGVRAHYQGLVQALKDEHQAQHAMMDCLGETLWQAGRQGGAPDDTAYLACLEKRIQEI